MHFQAYDSITYGYSYYKHYKEFTINNVICTFSLHITVMFNLCPAVICNQFHILESLPVSLVNRDSNLYDYVAVFWYPHVAVSSFAASILLVEDFF